MSVVSGIITNFDYWSGFGTWLQHHTWSKSHCLHPVTGLGKRTLTFHLNIWVINRINHLIFVWISFSLIFARGKRFVAAFKTCSSLLKVWDIEEAVRNPKADVTVSLPSPYWSIQIVDGLFSPNTTVHPVYSAHKDYQIIFFGRNGHRVNIYMLLSTRDQIGCSNINRYFCFHFVEKNHRSQFLSTWFE